MKVDYIVSWFAKNSSFSKSEIENNMGINYLDQGLIDSFAFLEMIAACEEKFGISFTDDDFSNDEIFTISGLVNILESKS